MEKNFDTENDVAMSGEIEAIHLVTDCDFFPGCDIVISFKRPDGIRNEIKFSLRIAGEQNAPYVVKAGSMLIGFPVLGDEVQKINSVQLSFRRPAIISQFLADFSAHIASIAEVVNGLNITDGPRKI